MNTKFDRLVDPKLYLLEERTKATAYLLGLTAVLLAFGLWYGTVLEHENLLLTQLCSKTIWTVILLIYAVIKFNHQHFVKLNLINNALGLWIWLTVFFMFVVFDPEPVGVLEAVLILPVMLECWELTLNIVSSKLYNCWRRQNEK